MPRNSVKRFANVAIKKCLKECLESGKVEKSRTEKAKVKRSVFCVESRQLWHYGPFNAFPEPIVLGTTLAIPKEPKKRKIAYKIRQIIKSE